MAQLPFLKTGQLVDQSGEVIREVDCSVWPLAAPVETNTGETYDWTGQADPDAAVELAQPNRWLLVGELRLRITGVTTHDLLPHVALRLRQTRQGGP